MRVRAMLVVWAGVVVGCAGGGGGTSAPPPPPPPPPAATTYSDVIGYGVPAGSEAVEVGRWPSWLHEKELVAACAAGEAFYADRCWATMAIDTDARTVTFATAGGDQARLAIGEAVPAALGTLVVSGTGTATCWDVWGDWTCGWPHHGNGGYVHMDGPWAPDRWTDWFSVWDLPPTPIDHGRATKRSPWVIGSQLDLRGGVVVRFLVKTTFLYGFRATKATPAAYDFVPVHDWPYAGTVRVNGQTLSLPLRLSDVTRATGVAARRAINELVIDVGDRTVRFVSQPYVMQMRQWYHGASGPGLTDEDLVTSIEMTATSVIEH